MKSNARMNKTNNIQSESVVSPISIKVRLSKLFMCSIIESNIAHFLSTFAAFMKISD